MNPGVYVVGVSRWFNENVRHVLIKIVLAPENSVDDRRDSSD